MTLEEALQKIDDLEGENSELKEGNDKLSTNNTKLTKELRDSRSGNRSDDEAIKELFKVQDELKVAEGEISKLSKELKVKGRDVEQLTTQNGELNGNLNKLLIDDNSLKSVGSLERHKPVDVEEAAAYAKRVGKPELVDGVAMVGDKPYDQWIREDLPETSKFGIYFKENENSGGGAGGGTGGGGDKKSETTKEMFTEMFPKK